MSMAGYRSVPVVPSGPRAFRYRIRRLGPIVGMMPPAMLGVIAILALRGNTSTGRGLGGFAAAVLAAPAMLAFGVPLASGGSKVALGVAVSAAAWILIAMVAARRATRSPVATWRDFWREYAWLAAGVWLGVLIAIVVLRFTVGSALI
jgi:hypothetical protein